MTTAPTPTRRSCDVGGLTINYDDRVLTPRPWTEQQARWAAEAAATAPPGPVLELCCGAGHIGLLTAMFSGRDLVAVDRDEVGCAYAVANARAAGLADRVSIRHADLHAACADGERFPVIVADPPWVPSADTGRFPDDPLSAIDGGGDGLDVARACVQVIAAHLHRDGVAVLQIGEVAQLAPLEECLPPGLRVAEFRVVDRRGVIVLLVPQRSPGLSG